MCRGDRFTAAEVAGLLDHPILARLLRNLIFVLEPGIALGYPERGPNGLRFRAHDGTIHTVEGTAARLGLAHSHDLLASGAWSAWQHNCFAAERIQPFKQVFCELYVPTASEARGGYEAASARYAGQQVQPGRSWLCSVPAAGSRIRRLG